MSRDSNGNYSLPAGNPVVSGTTIESVWANTTMQDIAAALTDSLSRSGDGGMLQPFQFVNGAVGAPGATFLNDTNTGMWLAAAGDLRFSSAGVQSLRLQETVATLPGNLALSNAAAEISASAGSLTIGALGALSLESASGDITLTSVNQVLTPSLNFDVTAGGLIDITGNGSGNHFLTTHGGLVISTMDSHSLILSSSLDLGLTSVADTTIDSGGTMTLTPTGTFTVSGGSAVNITAANGTLNLNSTAGAISVFAGGGTLTLYSTGDAIIRKPGNQASTAFRAEASRHFIAHQFNSDPAVVTNSAGTQLLDKNGIIKLFLKQSTDHLALPSLPTSNAGLVAGEIYRDGGTPDAVLKVK